MKLLFIYIYIHVVAENIQHLVIHSVRTTECSAETSHVCCTSLVVH